MRGNVATPLRLFQLVTIRQSLVPDNEVFASFVGQCVAKRLLLISYGNAVFCL